jgi:hypothetical protein
MKFRLETRLLGKFAMDMAGFALNVEVLWKYHPMRFNTTSKGGFQETKFLEICCTLDDYFDWKTLIHIYVCGKCRTQFMLLMEKSVTFTGTCYHVLMRLYRMDNSSYSNMTSFFRFVNKRASYPFGIISLVHGNMCR